MYNMNNQKLCNLLLIVADRIAKNNKISLM